MTRFLSPILLCALFVFAGIACGDDDDEIDGGDQANGDATTAPADTGNGENGGDDDDIDTGETPSGDMEEYFAAVEAIAIPTDEVLNEIGDVLNNATPQTDAEYIDVFQTSYQQAGQTLESAYLELAALTPPAEAVAAHDAFLGSLETVLATMSIILEESESVTTGDELDAIFDSYDTELSEADANMDEACLDLQGVADANDIDADLRCGD